MRTSQDYIPVFNVRAHGSDYSPTDIVGKASVVDGKIVIELTEGSSMKDFLDLGKLRCLYLNGEILVDQERQKEADEWFKKSQEENKR